MKMNYYCLGVGVGCGGWEGGASMDEKGIRCTKVVGKKEALENTRF